MHKLVPLGRSMFACGIIGLGLLCFIYRDFMIGRPPANPSWLSISPVLAHLLAAVSILAGIILLINKEGAWGALVIAVLILLFSVSRHLPGFKDNWLNSYKALALFGGALLIACSYFEEHPHRIPRFMSGKNILKNTVFTGSLLLTLFFVAGAYAHIKFAEFVVSFMPEYIPFHSFFNYFCAACLFSGGIGLLIPSLKKWAALLSGIMLTGWFFLLHIPRLIVNMNDASDRMGLCESFTFAGIFFCLAGMYGRRTDGKLL